MKGGKCVVLLVLLAMVEMNVVAAESHDYAEALSKCILFFEGQRSGKLPSSQRMTWRRDSALNDGSDVGMDLVGGYYDAGDNVKFNFPMAFTTTMLAWSVLEFGKFMGSERKHALEALRWGTDYFLKATSVPNTVVAQVGDPHSDHNCWERPEDMDTLRTTYVVNRTHPGAEVSSEIAAALAAASIVFKTSDINYSKLLLERATKVFNFARKYPGSYNPSVGAGVCPFYCDYNGYLDELIWGASWLSRATKKNQYWNYIIKNVSSLTPTSGKDNNGVDYSGGTFAEFGWDAKHAGINVLSARRVLKINDLNSSFLENADRFVCSILPESSSLHVQYSPGGLLVKPGGSNLQHATSLSFLMLVYARYLKVHHRTVECPNMVVTPQRLVDWAKSQVDYILGSNPLGMSYMVGYGKKFPRRIHHRGATLPSVDKRPQPFMCHEGDPYFQTQEPDQNLLVGAIIGGPDINDQFEDSRYNVAQSEPTTYLNAPFVGVLAFFKHTTDL